MAERFNSGGRFGGPIARNNRTNMASALGGGGRLPGGGGGDVPDLPVRMAVDAKFVGAIIGQGGSKIRDITKESKARCVVDTTRGVRVQDGHVEKVINIYGQPENCSKACRRILEVIKTEKLKDNESEEDQNEYELKLRAHNQLVGRLIGKAGQTIRKLMDETDCTVFVSNINEVNAFNMERTITIRGALDSVEKAELRISEKLRLSFEHDMMSGPNMSMGGGAAGQHSMALPQMMGGGGGYVDSLQLPLYIPQAGGGGAALHSLVGQPTNILAGRSLVHPNMMMVEQMAAPPAVTEVVHMWVPNAIVGALIGTKGVHIRNVIRMTGAHIRIESNSGEEDASRPARRNQQQQEDRLVSITGTPDQQYKAQLYVYHRYCESVCNFFEEVRLCTEINVATRLVGRIIGKGGQNVRELQRLTGAQVKIPEDVGVDGGAGAATAADDTIVRITGNFNASWGIQTVQSRIRQLIQQHQMQLHQPAAFPMGQQQQRRRRVANERNEDGGGGTKSSPPSSGAEPEPAADDEESDKS